MAENSPVIEDDVPIIGVEGEEEKQPLKVTVDGIEGSCFISYNGWSSLKIVIQLVSPHPKLGETFATKYFRFEEGVMKWGHDGEEVEILHLE